MYRYQECFPTFYTVLLYVTFLVYMSICTIICTDYVIESDTYLRSLSSVVLKTLLLVTTFYIV